MKKRHFIELGIISAILMVLSLIFWDKSIIYWVNQEHHNFRSITKLMSFMLVPESNLIFWTTAFFFAITYLKKMPISKGALFITISIGVTNFLTAVLKFIVGRSRPMALLEQGVYGMKLFATKGMSHGFPSGHAATAFALSTALSCFIPKARYILYALALFFSLSRVALLKHYPSDVMGSAIVALFCTYYVRKKLKTFLSKA